MLGCVVPGDRLFAWSPKHSLLVGAVTRLTLLLSSPAEDHGALCPLHTAVAAQWVTLYRGHRRWTLGTVSQSAWLFPFCLSFIPGFKRESKVSIVSYCAPAAWPLGFFTLSH